MAHILDSLFKDMRGMQKRFKRADKDRFLSYAEDCLQEWGYKTERHTTKGRILTSVNLETTNKKPDYIILAHYDTPTILPPWLEPLVRLVGHTRQLLLAIAVVATLLLIDLIFNGNLGWIELLFYLSFLTLLIPNPKNYNDNTSGILGLLQLAHTIKDSKGLKRRVQFVLVDNEELMLTGAEHLRQRWEKEEHNFKDAEIISLDCIGWGTTPVIVRNGVSRMGENFLEVMQEKEPDAKLINMGVLPVNDNYIFRDRGAVLLTFMNPTLIKGGFYIKNIHSILDNKLNLKKIDFMTERVLAFIGQR